MWLGAVGSNGYGVLKANVAGQPKVIGAHRLALALATGEWPESAVFALHSCDHPLCVNPAHLRWGDNQQNTQDKTARARQSRVSGGANGRAQLAEGDVRRIRALPKTRGLQTKLAREYGVSQSTISLVLSGQTWAGVA